MINASQRLCWMVGVLLLLAILPSVTSELTPALASDVDVLMDIYDSMQGRKMWPKQWRNNWGEKADPCHPWKNWWGTHCHAGRINLLEHRSGMARGTIPPSINRLSAVERFDFSSNQLTGSLPTELGNLTSATSIAFSQNQLSGTLPSSLGTLGSQLRYLMLEDNKFVGTIPEAWSGLQALEGLFLHHNDLSGTIPDGLAKLSNMLHLRLDSNRFGGIVPAPIFGLPRLLALQLDGNPELQLPPGTSEGKSKASTDIARLHLFTANGADGFPWHVPDGGRGAPLGFMAMGDFGTGGQKMAATRELASAFHFNRFAEWLDSTFTISVGDNFYANVDDLTEFFHESFEALYTVPALQRPWYPAYGNHDNPKQFSYREKSSRWKQSGTFFNVSDIEVVGDVKLDMYVHDSVSSIGRKFRPAWRTFADYMQKNHSRFHIIVTHFPVVSGGCHGQERGARHADLLIKNVTGVFLGHDHHLEYLVHNANHHFAVGGFARGPCTKERHKASKWIERKFGGFTYVTVDETLMNVTFVNQFGAIMAVASVPYNWYAYANGTHAAPTKAHLAPHVRGNNTRTKWWLTSKIRPRHMEGSARKAAETATTTTTVTTTTSTSPATPQETVAPAPTKQRRRQLLDDQNTRAPSKNLKQHFNRATRILTSGPGGYAALAALAVVPVALCRLFLVRSQSSNDGAIEARESGQNQRGGHPHV